MIKKFFKNQLSLSFEEKENLFNNLSSKRYYDGKKINLGDTILFAILKDEYKTSIIILSEEHLSQFKIEENSSSYFPILTKVKS